MNSSLRFQQPLAIEANRDLKQEALSVFCRAVQAAPVDSQSFCDEATAESTASKVQAELEAGKALAVLGFCQVSHGSVGNVGSSTLPSSLLIQIWRAMAS